MPLPLPFSNMRTSMESIGAGAGDWRACRWWRRAERRRRAEGSPRSKISAPVSVKRNVAPLVVCVDGSPRVASARRSR